jgi:hypothetical protein
MKPFVTTAQTREVETSVNQALRKTVSALNTSLGKAGTSENSGETDRGGRARSAGAGEAALVRTNLRSKEDSEKGSQVEPARASEECGRSCAPQVLPKR